jgi:hypothetical protein
LRRFFPPKKYYSTLWDKSAPLVFKGNSVFFPVFPPTIGRFWEAAMSEIFNFDESPVEELRDLAPGTDGFDFGTSPHGLAAGLPQAYQETPGVSSDPSPAKPVLTSPEIYRDPQVLESCRIIEEAAKKPKQVFTIALTEAQLLHAWSQSERTLNRTLKNIRRGLCVEEDSHVERSLYELLDDVVYSRLSWVSKARAVIAGNVKGSSTWRSQMHSGSEFDQEDEL